MSELSNFLLDLLESFNTSKSIEWKDPEKRKGRVRHVGVFTHKDDTYNIFFEVYDLDTVRVAEFAFEVNGEYKVLKNDKDVLQRLSILIGGSIDKLKELSPDFVLVKVDKNSEKTEERMDFYSLLFRKLKSRIGYSHSLDWVEGKGYFTMVIGKDRLPNKEDLDAYIKLISVK